MTIKHLKKMPIKTLLAAATLLTTSMAAPTYAEVTVLGWPGGPEEEALRTASEAYNQSASNADKVKLIFFNRDGFFDKLAADLAAGTSEFDINLLATYAIGRYAPFMDAIELPVAAKEVFGDKVLATMRYDAKQYGVPTDLSMHFMYYRQDLIEQLMSDAEWQSRYAEISEKYLGEAMQPKDPDSWTWDDWMVTALFFTKSINSDSPTRYGAVLQMKNLLFNMMVWHGIARAYGGDWADESGAVSVDSPAYRTALELYKKLYDEGTSPRDSTTYEYAEANAAFGAGQVATMLQWNAAFVDLDNAEKNPAVAGKVGTVAPPAGPDGRFTHIHGLGLGINRASNNKEGATKFINWLASADAMTIYAKAGGTPALSDSVTDALMKDRPDLATLGKLAGSYGFVMNGGTSAKALQIYELQAKHFTAYWSGATSLDEALAETAAGMAKLLQP